VRHPPEALAVLAGEEGRGDRVAEVYPAATLRRWMLDHPELEGAQRAEILDWLEKLMPTMEFQAEAREQVVNSDHAFDALICAITARAVATGRTTLPMTDEEVSRAAIEGWIHVPTVGPNELMQSYLLLGDGAL
jgi:hypothetical protein